MITPSTITYVTLGRHVAAVTSPPDAFLIAHLASAIPNLISVSLTGRRAHVFADEKGHLVIFPELPQMLGLVFRLAVPLLVNSEYINLLQFRGRC